MSIQPSDKIVRGSDIVTIGARIKNALADKQNMISSVTVNVDSETGDPSGSAEISGDTLVLNFSGLKGETGEGEKGEKGDKGDKGDQGNTGSSVDYPFELVDNLDTDDGTKALSARQGKKLGDDVAYLMAGFKNLAPWSFKGTPSIANPMFRDVAFFPVSAGVATLRYGYTSTLVPYLMSPIYNLGEIGNSFSISFSAGEVITASRATYPGIVYLDENMLPYTQHLANSNPRTVTGTVSSTMKYIRLLFKVERILDAFIYDNLKNETLFSGADLNLATLENKESILSSDYWIDWGPNSRGDWIGWNFATTNVAATNQRSDINYPMFKNVGQNASSFDYSIGKIVALPAGQSALSIEFSCGEVDSGLMLRMLNPNQGLANYYAANENPRVVSIDTNQYTHVQLYFKTANYSSCYIKDVTNDEMLWQGASSID